MRPCDEFASHMLDAFSRGPRSRLVKVSRWARWILPLALLSGIAPSLGAQAIPAPLEKFLKKHASFDEPDLRALAGGQPAAKVSETKVGDEVAVVGAIRIAVPRDFFLQQFTNIVQFKREQSVPEVGKFGKPPTLEDLAGLQLHSQSVQALRECRAGHCALKLPSKDIQRFQKDISWSTTSAGESANQLFREVLLWRVHAYLESGNAGLADYNDKKSPVSLARGSAHLLGESAYLRQFAPHLAECLEQFPSCDSGIESFLYWSKENYGHGLKPVVSMTHVMIDRQPASGDDWIWEASKQLYADHYSDGSLGVTLLVNGSDENGKPSFYLVYLNRTRSDSLNGFFAFLVRGIIRGKARGELSDQLERTRTRIEAQWSAESAAAGRTAGSRVTRNEEQ
ncbi:MAG: hypothetical protein KGL59_08675 [Acidobacteriota bacterium]|nr:hypothetical protein [Acidobacteriota bacterium]